MSDDIWEPLVSIGPHIFANSEVVVTRAVLVLTWAAHYT